MESVTTEKKEEKYKVFGDVDKNKDGKIKSEYPAFYHISLKDQLQEDIEHKERMLEHDLVRDSEKPITKARLKQEKIRMDEIEEGQPKLSGKELDEISKMVGTNKKGGTLGEKITSSMYSRSDGERGFADAHEVARRWSTPCLELDELEVPFVKSCDVLISNNRKVTQIGAEKAWKIGRRLIGETSNTEILRKP